MQGPRGINTSKKMVNMLTGGEGEKAEWKEEGEEPDGEDKPPEVPTPEFARDGEQMIPMSEVLSMVRAYTLNKGGGKGGCQKGGKGKGGGFDGNCSHCGKYGHRMRECWKKDEEMNAYRKGKMQGWRQKRLARWRREGRRMANQRQGKRPV